MLARQLMYADCSGFFVCRGQPGGWSLSLGGQDKVTKEKAAQVHRP